MQNLTISIYGFSKNLNTILVVRTMNYDRPRVPGITGESPDVARDISRVPRRCARHCHGPRGLYLARNYHKSLKNLNI